jgi:hypothetical protein
LETDDSFIEAFCAASAAIEKREWRDDRIPAKPRIRIGAEIAAKLNALWISLASLWQQFAPLLFRLMQ